MNKRLIWYAFVATLQGTQVACGVQEPIDTLSTASDELAAKCASVDPTGGLGSFQDFELVVDPSDPASQILFTAASGSNVIVARFDPFSGLATTAASVVATNFGGTAFLNGPEWARNPFGALGILYAGKSAAGVHDGVHAAWRAPQTTSWNTFNIDINGVPFPALTAPKLPASRPGTYPTGSPPFGRTTLGEFQPGNFTFQSAQVGSYGSLYYGKTTDLSAYARAMGWGLVGATAAHPTLDGYVFLSSCANSVCNLRQLQVDGFGGVMPGTVSVAAPNVNVPFNYDALVTAVHPSNKAVIVYAWAGTNIDVFEQPNFTQPLVKIATVAAGTGSQIHYRVVAGRNELVLHYLDKSTAATNGSYTSTLRLVNGAWVATPGKKISSAAGGSEFLYVPTVNRYALYSTSSTFQRCWVTP
jgi:hypothetical protein